MKRKIVLFLTLMLILVSLVSAKPFIIRDKDGNNLMVLDNTTGYLNVTKGQIAEEGVALNLTYWQIADAVTPNTGDTTHVSTAGQIFDYIVTLDYVAGAWNSLTNMTLNDGLLYIGDASNNPAAQTMSGHATITNAGVVTVSATSGLDASNITTGTIDNARISLVEDEIPQLTSSWANDMDADQLVGLDALNNAILLAGENITTGTVADARIASTIARDAEVAALPVSTFDNDEGYFDDIGNFSGTLTTTKTCIYTTGTGIVCDTTPTTGTVTSIATTGPIAGGTITATGTISLTACGDGEYYLYNTTSAAWACEVETLGGMQDLVDDVTPKLGGSLDVNGFNITDAAGTASIMINTSGVIITI